jgi:hypothetical protein
MKKILFLDHDGVICLQRNWGSRIKSQAKFDKFDDKAVKVLNEVIQETNCDIVVSSDWRLYGTLEELQQLYTERGILKTPIATTRLYPLFFGSQTWPERNRASEILEWVKDNLTEDDRWVAVDDLPMTEYIPVNFVYTPYITEGIKQTGIKQKIIAKLNK